MMRVLQGISRFACPPADRRWVDALFAEGAQLDSPNERFSWLLGTIGLLANRNAVRLAAALSPVSLLLLLATAVFAVMALVEYEGFAFEDDWYGVIATLLGTCLIAVAARNIRRGNFEPRL